VKSIVLHAPGGPENFIIEERVLPTPPIGWVLIQIKAFGLNRSELMTRKGLSPSVKFPRVLGIECVGIVAADPSGEFRVGQQVAAFMGGMGRDFDGGYSEFAVLPKTILMPFVSQLSWSVLGSLPEMFQTVYGCLHLALKINVNETLLIRGGSSSIGMLASELARHYGVTVIATTRSEGKITKLLENGATHVVIDNGNISHQLRSLFPDGVNKALELIGVETLPDTLQSVAQGGIVCMAGMLSEKWAFDNFAPMEVIPPTVCLTSYDSGQVRVPADFFQMFIDDIENNKIKITEPYIFSFENIKEAHALMDSNTATGKILVLTEN